MPQLPSRRAALLGGTLGLIGLGTGYLAIEDGTLPGRTRLRELLGQDGPAGTLPAVPAGLMVSGRFTSTHRLGRSCGWSIAYPTRRAERLPVVVVLHGRGGNHASAFGTDLGLQRYLAASGHRLALASIDGGDTYWHRRSTGEDAGAMVVEEFLPLLAQHGLDTSRLGLLGWSMGGFGALWLAGRLGPDKLAAVAVESPAIWHHASQTAPGAFDDPADFAAHDVFSHPDWVTGIGVRLDCGTGDGFYPAARDYAASITPRPAGGFEPGGHTQGYWRRMAPSQLDFLAARLT
jgi:dienelactone hydrolase